MMRQWLWVMYYADQWAIRNGRKAHVYGVRLDEGRWVYMWRPTEISYDRSRVGGVDG